MSSMRVFLLLVALTVACGYNAFDPMGDMEFGIANSTLDAPPKPRVPPRYRDVLFLVDTFEWEEPGTVLWELMDVSSLAGYNVILAATHDCPLDTDSPVGDFATKIWCLEKNGVEFHASWKTFLADTQIKAAVVWVSHWSRFPELVDFVEGLQHCGPDLSRRDKRVPIPVIYYASTMHWIQMGAETGERQALEGRWPVKETFRRSRMSVPDKSLKRGKRAGCALDMVKEREMDLIAFVDKIVTDDRDLALEVEWETVAFAHMHVYIVPNLSEVPDDREETNVETSVFESKRKELREGLLWCIENASVVDSWRKKQPISRNSHCDALPAARDEWHDKEADFTLRRGEAQLFAGFCFLHPLLEMSVPAGAHNVTGTVNLSTPDEVFESDTPVSPLPDDVTRAYCGHRVKECDKLGLGSVVVGPFTRLTLYKKLGNKEIRYTVDTSSRSLVPEVWRVGGEVQYVLEILPDSLNFTERVERAISEEGEECQSLVLSLREKIQSNEYPAEFHFEESEYTAVMDAWDTYDRDMKRDKGFRTAYEDLDEIAATTYDFSLANSLRIAYFVLLGPNDIPEQIEAMFTRLLRDDHFLLIHVDDKTGENVLAVAQRFAKRDNVRLMEERRRLNWGGFTLTDVELNALRVMTNWSSDWTYWINLSGSDFPIKSDRVIRRTLSTAQPLNYVETFEMKDEYMQARGLHCAFVECRDHVYRVSDYKPSPKGLRLFGGSMWTVLHRDFSEFLVRSLYQDSKEPGAQLIRDLYKYSVSMLISDEVFFQTALSNTRFANTLYPANMRYVNWVANATEENSCLHNDVVDWCGKSPTYFQHQSVHALINSPTLFARKFSMKADPKALTVLGDYLTWMDERERDFGYLVGGEGGSAHEGFDPNHRNVSGTPEVIFWSQSPGELVFPARAWASSREGFHGAPNAIDGDLSTRWASEHGEQSQVLTVELASPILLSRAALLWENSYALEYTVDVSVDGQTWYQAFDSRVFDRLPDEVVDDKQGVYRGVVVHRIPLAPPPASSERVSSHSQYVKYVRLHCLKRASPWGYSLWEVILYGVSET